eukprot:superscaffoldBa00012687_g25740
MSKVQMLSASVKQRLTAAAEEIILLFERSIAEYEEEIDRQRRLLQLQVKPETTRADVCKLIIRKEEVPPEQQDPEPPHIKEEQEELWTSQEGEQLHGLEEADITTFTLTLVPMTSEDDEEKPQSSQLHQRQTEQMKTEADGEDCGGSEPDKHLQPVSDDKTHESFELETKVKEDDWRETSEPHFISAKLRRTERQNLQPAAQLNRWKQKLMETTVEDQNQPDIYNLILLAKLHTVPHLELSS